MSLVHRKLMDENDSNSFPCWYQPRYFLLALSMPDGAFYTFL